jgi:hypothetical protein
MHYLGPSHAEDWMAGVKWPQNTPSPDRLYHTAIQFGPVHRVHIRRNMGEIPWTNVVEFYTAEDAAKLDRIDNPVALGWRM